MASNQNFERARRRLDESLRALETTISASGEADVGDDGQKPSSGRTRIDARRRRPPPELRAPARQSERRDAATTPTTAEPQGPEPSQEPRSAAAMPSEHAAQRTGEAGRAAVPISEALTRLLVGALLLLLEHFDRRADNWESRAGIAREQPASAVLEGEIGSARFRDALIGWIFETEERLRPQGNPIDWLRDVVRYSFGTVFAVVIDLLPLPRLGLRRSRGAVSQTSDEDTRRWMQRGKAEEERSRRFARAAIDDTLDRVIGYLARRPAVGRALGHIVRSPAMDDAVHTIVQGPVIEQAIERVANSPALDDIIVKVGQSPALDDVIVKVGQSPALDDVIARVGQSPALDATVQRVVQSPVIDEAVQHIVRTPAMEDAIRYLVQTPAMDEALDTLSRSPALVELVTTQSTSVVSEIVEEIRAHAVSGDMLAESIARRLLRRPPRATLPTESRYLKVVDRRRLETTEEVRST